MNYKGFNKDMTCRGFQFEEGKEYEEDGAVLCEKGFHACEYSLNVFQFYPLGTSVYHEVEQSGIVVKGDVKTASSKIRVGVGIGVPGLVKAAIEYTKSHTLPEKSETAGDGGAATSRGKVSVGENGAGLVRGNNVRIRGGINAVLTIVEENERDFTIKDWLSFIVDGEKVKPDTWYKLVDGQLVVVPENE